MGDRRHPRRGMKQGGGNDFRVIIIGIIIMTFFCIFVRCICMKKIELADNQ